MDHPHHLVDFLVRWGASAAALWAAVAWVSPGNRANTFGRAALLSIFLSVAWYVTLAKFLWFLLVPWLLYAAIWVGVVMASYRVDFGRALLIALALAFLSWLISAIFGVHTFRAA